MDDQGFLHLLIQRKLDDGRLPHNSIPRIWGGPGDGEACSACEEPIPKNQLLMEGISLDGDRRRVQFHVGCFYLWDKVRKASERTCIECDEAIAEHEDRCILNEKAYHARCFERHMRSLPKGPRDPERR